MQKYIFPENMKDGENEKTEEHNSEIAKEK